jgi:arginine decarboxylase
MSVNGKNIQESRQTYGIEGWGAGYFGISARGFVQVHPFGTENVAVDLQSIVNEAVAKKCQTPLIVRFPQVLDTQLSRLHKSFQHAMEETKYIGNLRCVFPFKVNQRKEFIDELVKSGKKHCYGLEVGTKPELLAAMSYELHDDALLICNGFKDSRYIELAFEAKKLGKNVVLVIEGTDELKYIINHTKRTNEKVDIGLRAKLYAKGSGLWEKSGGTESKFGLSSVEMMEALWLLEESGLKDQLAMVHYHIGSQITEIKRVKNAMKEAARVYSKISKMGFENLRFLNIGGGIGVDYDGSKTSFYVSANYTLQEFANDVVYIVQEVCRSENVKEPNIVSESGRAVAAYHAVLVTDVREVEQVGGDISEVVVEDKHHKLVKDLMNVYNGISSKNYVEFYHDAIEYKEELYTLFGLGYVGLEERSKSEIIFTEICNKALHFHGLAGVQLEEFEELAKGRVSKYLANFSIFQSIPDTWSIEQLFPVMPISRLDEKAQRSGVIVDITCDSDGCLDKFVDKRDVKTSLELHSPEPNSPYFIGFFLVGAYQEALGNNHNLFGAVNEAIVTIDNEGGVSHVEYVKGEVVGELLRVMNYTDEGISSGFENQIQQQLKKGNISSENAKEISAKLSGYFDEYPYLLLKSRLGIVE